MTSPQAGWLKFSASGRPRIPDIASIIQDAATWPRACAPSSIWPMRFSFGIARRRLDGGCRTGGPCQRTLPELGVLEFVLDTPKVVSKSVAALKATLAVAAREL